jgi:hypothetical protein
MSVQIFITSMALFTFFAWIGTLLSECPRGVVWSMFTLLAVMTSAAAAFPA